MSELSPIDKIIKNNFPNKDDCRIDWWQRIQAYIKAGRFELAIHQLKSHNFDIDYNEQTKAIVDEIAYNDNNNIGHVAMTWRVTVRDWGNHIDTEFACDLPCSWNAETVREHLMLLSKHCKDGTLIVANRNGFRENVTVQVGTKE